MRTHLLFGRFVRRADGQTLVLMALMLLVLVAIIGLSVDVGNAYGRQRTDQQAANAAALAAMNYHIENKQQSGGNDSGVRLALQKALEANGVRAGQYEIINSCPAGAGCPSPNIYSSNPDKATVWAEYLTKSGTQYIWAGAIGGNTPAKVQAVRVTVREPVTTYFARVVGRTHLTVRAVGYAAMCSNIGQIYPLSFDVETIRVSSGGDLVAEETYVWIEGGLNTGNIGWFDYDGANNGRRGLESDWKEGRDPYDPSFMEAEVQGERGPASTYQNNRFDMDDDDNPGTPDGGDWLSVVPGVGNAGGIQDELNYHINHSHPGNYAESETDWTKLTFPIYSSLNSDYGKNDSPPAPANSPDSWPAGTTYGVYGDDTGAPIGEQGGENYGYKFFTIATMRLTGYRLPQGNSRTTSGGQVWPCGNPSGPGFCMRFLGSGYQQPNACVTAGDQ